MIIVVIIIIIIIYKCSTKNPNAEVVGGSTPVFEGSPVRVWGG